jgi:hypothetical protein
VNAFLKAVEESALSTLVEGGALPGLKMVAGRGARYWSMSEDSIEEELIGRGLGGPEIYDMKLKSVAKIEKEHGKDKIEGLVAKKAGNPKVVPESDRRKPIKPSADEAFSEIK